MHYKNGREAKEGDVVVYVETYPSRRVNVGVIHSLVIAEGCNCQITKILPGGVSLNNCSSLKELYHAEDALLAIEPEALAPKKV